MPISIGTTLLSAIGDYAKVSLGDILLWSAEEEEIPGEPVILTNKAAYDQDTWVTWNKGTGVTADSTGMQTTLPASGYTASKYSLGLEVGKKYVLLYNIVSNTLVGNTLTCDIAGCSLTYFLNSDGSTGNRKFVFTPASVVNDRIFIVQNSANGTGSAKFKDFRIFEVPTGSQLDTDVTNAVSQTQIDALCTKYPFVSL